MTRRVKEHALRQAPQERASGAPPSSSEGPRASAPLSLVSGTTIAAITAAAMIAQQVSGKAIRDAVFLSTFRVVHLPVMMAIAAGASLAAVLGLSKLFSRRAPATVLPAMFGINATCMAAAWGTFHSMPRFSASFIYLAAAILGPVVMSAFWSVINERFDPHTAKREVAHIASGGTVGGVLGGLAAWRLSREVSLSTAVGFLAILNVACVFGALLLSRVDANAARAEPVASASEERAGGPFSVLRGTPFLVVLALLVSLGSISSSLLDYAFSAKAAHAYGTGPKLLAFFSLFGVAVSLTSFFVQISVGKVAIEKLGLVTNVVVLQMLVIAGGVLALAVPTMAILGTLRGTEMVHRNTLFRSAYELFYTPIPETRKRVTKAIIDVAFDRFGTVLGSGIIIAVLWRSSHAEMRLIWVVLAIAVGTIVLAKRLHSGYVKMLADDLRRAADHLAEEEPVISDRAAARDEQGREQLIERVEALRHPEDAVDARAVEVVHAEGSEIAGRAAALLQGDPAQIRAALTGWKPYHAVLAPLAITHLGKSEVFAPARDALRGVVEYAIGTLTDVLLNSNVEFGVRQRIPSILATCPTQRAADGLLLGLADPRFEIRYVCGRSLLKLTDRDVEDVVVITEERAIKLVQDELARVAPEVLELVEDIEGDDGDRTTDPSIFGVVQRDRVSRQLEHLFTILALVLDREPLRLAFGALHHADKRRRGTALEYIQTVLPSELRDSVWPLLETGAPLLARPREAAVVLAELANSLQEAQTPQEFHASRGSGD